MAFFDAAVLRRLIILREAFDVFLFDAEGEEILRWKLLKFHKYPRMLQSKCLPIIYKRLLYKETGTS